MIGINEHALKCAKEKGIVASCVTGRLHRDTNGNTYNSFTLEVKVQGDKFPITLAVGLREYGYGDEYRRRAERVLRHYGLADMVDFYNSTHGKKADMFKLYDGFVQVDL